MDKVKRTVGSLKKDDSFKLDNKLYVNLKFYKNRTVSARQFSTEKYKVFDYDQQIDGVIEDKDWGSTAPLCRSYFYRD